MTSFARSGYGIVHLIGIALFGRGPFFITGSGLRRLLSLLFNTVVLMALCYNSSLSGKNVTGIQLVLLYVRQFFGRFMWLALPTALTQFFGGLMIVQIYDPFTAVVMTPSRMRSMPALCDIFLLFRRVGRFFLEYCLPFVIMLPCIIFTEIYTSSFDDYTAYGYALGFIFWLIREAVGKKFVATFWLMIFAELAAAISWLLPAF